MWLTAALLGLSMAAWPAPVTAQLRVSAEERFFKIEWQTEQSDGRAPAIAGFVSHDYLYPVQRVQVQVQVLDETGRVTYEALSAISEVSPGRRSAFRVSLPAAGARFVVTVHSFEFGAAQSP